MLLNQFLKKLVLIFFALKSWDQVPISSFPVFRLNPNTKWLSHLCSPIIHCNHMDKSYYIVITWISHTSMHPQRQKDHNSLIIGHNYEHLRTSSHYTNSRILCCWVSMRIQQLSLKELQSKYRFANIACIPYLRTVFPSWIYAALS